MKSFFLLFFPFLLVFCQETSFPIETEDRQPRQVYDVVVIGAGLSGLSFARRMKQMRPDATILLLEARGQVGGRVRARSMATAMGDDWLDLGSQFVSHDHHAIQRIANDVGVKLVPQSTCGERTLLLEGVRRRKREVSWSPELSVRPSFRELIASPDATVLARQSVADFVQSKNLPIADAAATNRLLQTFFDAPEQKVSALQVALTAASDNATVTELLLNTGHGQSLLFEKGAYDFARALADGHRIEYNQRVIGINRQSSPAVVMTTSSSFLAKQVVVAVPPAIASSIVFNPPVEQNFQRFLEHYKPQGDAFYFTMTFPTAFWRAMNKSGQIIHTTSKGPLAWLTTFDLTTDTHCVSAAGTTGILWGIAHFMEDVPEQERLATYSTIVKKGLGMAIDPLDIKDMQLASDPVALGSIGVLPPGFPLEWLNFLTGAIQQGQVIFAAAEFSQISTGLMNGAIVSGEMAAEMIMKAFEGGAMYRDSPVPGFVYSTSTHYPPMDDNIHIMLAPALSRDSPFSSTTYRYSTSTHYPPSVFENSVNEDAAVQQNSPQSQFIYRTSTMYPSTEKPEREKSTTFKHFSFGNLDEEEPANMIAAPSNEKNSIENRQFVYRTSTQYPSTEAPLATSTFTHFSFGNVGTNGVIEGYDGTMSSQGKSNQINGKQLGGVNPQIIQKLQQTAQQASSSDVLTLARNLSSIVQELLEGL